jgi:hypothetical protein
MTSLGNDQNWEISFADTTSLMFASKTRSKTPAIQVASPLNVLGLLEPEGPDARQIDAVFRNQAANGVAMPATFYVPGCDSDQ